MIAEPFPHVVLTDLWPDELLDRVISEIPPESDPRWARYKNEREGKLEGSNPSLWGPATCEVLEILHSPAWCDEMSATFDIPNLSADTMGGGYHVIPRGGRLAMHVDFNRGPNGLYRRVNCLIYLNHDWRPEYRGELILGDAYDASIPPIFNTTAIFATSESSWHGHPRAWDGPEPRKSLAVYYYSPEHPEESTEPHTTRWAGE